MVLVLSANIFKNRHRTYRKLNLKENQIDLADTKTVDILLFLNKDKNDKTFPVEFDHLLVKFGCV